MAPSNRRIVESWIWLVFNPQVEHCDWELSVLQRGLTFRALTKGFEQLKPLREALMPDGKLVFDDMTGDVPQYDALVAAHDDALADLLKAARTLFLTLNANLPFRASVEDARDEWLAAAGTAPAPLRSVELSHLIAWQIENVINQIPGDLNASRVDASLWNAEHQSLTGLAAGDDFNTLKERRQRFEAAVRTVKDQLKVLRKEYSRSLDIPVAPTVGSREDALK